MVEVYMRTLVPALTLPDGNTILSKINPYE